MDEQRSVYMQSLAREISGGRIVTPVSEASARIARITTSPRSWTLPGGQVPLGYIPRQPATV